MVQPEGENLNSLLHALEEWERHLAQMDSNGMRCTDVKLIHNFNKLADKSASRNVDHANCQPPLSIRFTFKERARLDKERKSKSLAAYIRLRLFGKDAAGDTLSLDVTRDTSTGQSPTDDAEETVTEALRDLAPWLYRQLRAEFDPVTSDEAIEEGITVNEDTFTEGGRRSRFLSQSSARSPEGQEILHRPATSRLPRQQAQDSCFPSPATPSDEHQGA